MSHVVPFRQLEDSSMVQHEVELSEVHSRADGYP